MNAASTETIANSDTAAIPPATREELAALLAIRGHVYGLASNLCRMEPSRESLAAIAASDALRLLADDIAPIAEILAGARECLGERAALKAAAEDYCRLYIGPGPLPAPLWESVYRDRESILFGEATLAVRKFYAACGLEYAHKTTMPDDHIAIELECMCRLNAAMLERLESGQSNESATEYADLAELQLRFLERHLLQWAPQSFALQIPHASTRIYRGLADLIISFLPYDARLMCSLQKDRPACGHHAR